MTATAINTVVIPSFVMPASDNCGFTGLRFTGLNGNADKSAAYKPETQPQRQHASINNPTIWQDNNK
jgi:hypothetical protein